MDQADFDAKVRAALSVLINQAFSTAEACEDEAREARLLISALRRLADDLSSRRDDMVVTFDCGTCFDCGRRFTVDISVARERMCRTPEDCPECFHKRTGNVSIHASTVRYVY